MASTLTLQQVVDYARTQTRLLPIVGVGGFSNEPALSICNDVLQELLSSPYNWRFNRTNLPTFTTVNYQQDYVVTGATATVNQKGIIAIMVAGQNGATQSGTTVTITTQIPHGFAQNDSVTIAGVVVSGYNGTFTITGVTSTTFTYTTGAGLTTPSGAPGISNINWVERCVLEDFQNTSNVKPRHDIEVVANLPLESIIQPPFKVAFQLEDLVNQTVTFRTWPVASSQIWTAYIDYQVKPPIKTDLSQTWAPFPDELAYVIRQGFLAKALAHAEDPRAPQATQQFEMYLAKALDIKDQEILHGSFFPDRPMLYGG